MNNDFTKNLLNECTFRTSRSGGPGGQHVNKTETKVELYFNVKESNVLTEEQKSKVLNKLSGHITLQNEIRLVAAAHRSQAANKKVVIQKFIELILRGLKTEKKRLHTVMPEAARLTILHGKKKHSEKKKLRQYRTSDFL